jgi:hypothetical protein
MQIKVTKAVTEITLSLTEEEARQLAGLLAAANSLNNETLLDIEDALVDAVDGNLYDFASNEFGHFELVK